jgi:hypothetical protein
MSEQHPHSRPAPPSQAGYVTVLVAVLFGVAFTATVLGSAAYIRSTQAQSTAGHAQVQAQLKAWTGAEIVREYLAAVQTNNALPALAAVVAGASSTALTITGVSGVTANLTAVDSATNPTLITAQIVGTTAAGTPAQATSTVQVVYAASGGSTPPSSVALNFNRNLNLSGSITVNAPSGSTYSINVMGDLTTGGNSINGVQVINSTGTINIGSGSAFQQLNSDCDVVISGSVTAVSVSAQRNVCMTQGSSVSGTSLANGSVLTQTGSGSNGTISAIANPTGVSSCAASGANQNGTTAATCPAPYAAVDLSFGAAGAANVNTDGSVLLASGNIGKLNAVGNLNVSSAGSVGTGVIGGTVSKPSWDGSVNVTSVANHTVSITPAVSVSLTTSQFNAYTLQSTANYQFTINSSGYAQVTVTNINGVTNGTYYLGSYGGGYQDYLCTALAAGSSPPFGTCQVPAVSASVKICKGYSAYNTCFSYSGGMWTIVGTSMAPGIAWFQGNLTVSSGTYYNSFIATGNITTSGANTVYSPNYAGYSGTVAGTMYAPTGICSNSYFNSSSNLPLLYPTQFCTISTQTYNSSASSGIGNFAFLAGSWVGANYPGQALYVGGNISIGASSNIYGNVEAGNEFTSGGSTTITGAVTALAQGTAVENSMGGSTTFNFKNLPSTFTVSSGLSSGGGTTGAINIQWARYL